MAFLDGEVEMKPAKLALRTGLPRPTVYRLVNEMVAWGVLERSSGGVRLGMRLFELGEMVPRRRDLQATALPIMNDLAVATGQSVHLAVLDGLEVLYLEKISPRAAPGLPSRVGGRMPLHCTAVGKSLLAFAEPGIQQQVLSAPLSRRTRRTIVDPRALVYQLDRIRTTKTAFEFEESTPGIVCVACPVVGRSGTVVASVSISGWTNLINVDRVAPAVHTAALTLSRALRTVAFPASGASVQR
jgi:IclR family acetate operon transcriptional repressor